MNIPNANPKYIEQVKEVYPHAVDDMITYSGASIKTGTEYSIIRARDDQGEIITDAETIMFIPGFGEGIDNKISFAGELALRGYNVVLPEQNRDEKVKGQSLFSRIVDRLVPQRKREERQKRLGATAMQAHIFQDVMDSVEAIIDINDVSALVSHSYGSLIVNEMVSSTENMHSERFVDKDIIMLAPAGAADNERYPKLIKNWIKMMASESNKKRRADFPDHKGYTGRSSLSRLLKNIPRTFAEVGALRHETIDFNSVNAFSKQLYVLPYANDKLFPSRSLETAVDEVQIPYSSHSVPLWMTPIEPGKSENLRDGAVHDDEQFNPSRVVNVIDMILRNNQ